MPYRLERSRYKGGEWVLLSVSRSPSSPASLGLIGQPQERVRWVCDGVSVELWEWSSRIPLNPGDLQCTDFVAGWKLIERRSSPVPSADELAHFYVQN